MIKPIATADSSISDVLYELDVRGLVLLQPSQSMNRNGGVWIIINLEEIQSRRIFTGEGPYVWEAINSAYEKATTAGLRNSRLS